VVPKDHRGDPIEAERGQLPDGFFPLADGAEVAPRTEAGVEVVLRDSEDVRLVEKLVEELEAPALGKAGDINLGRSEAAVGDRSGLAEAARPGQEDTSFRSR